jgi:hypothetical protein
MFDEIPVRVRRSILCNSLDSIEQSTGSDPDELIDAHIAYVGLVPSEHIFDIAVLFDLLTARAIIEFLANFDVDEFPLSLCGFKVLRSRERKDMSFQPFEIVFHCLATSDVTAAQRFTWENTRLTGSDSGSKFTELAAGHAAARTAHVPLTSIPGS